jgi:hypothetical protein
MKIPEGWNLEVEGSNGCYWITIDGGEDGSITRAFDAGSHGAEALRRFKAALEAPTPQATIPLETLIAEIESNPEAKVVLDEMRKKNMLKGATVTDITPEQDDEPVADLTISHYKGYENRELEYYGDLPDGTYRLYAAPQSYSLKKAAEEALEILEEINSVSSCALTTEVIANLHKALESK